MINSNMRSYDFFTFGAPNEYGQPTLSNDPQGKIKMSVSITSHSAQDNILFQGCEYMGLTHDPKVNDTYVIDIDGERAKVLYVSPHGRFKQVFMTRMG